MAVESNLQKYFVSAMAIPHKSDVHPILFSTVCQPAAKQAYGRRLTMSIVSVS